MAKDYIFTNPEGRELKVSSPDGSLPTEQEVDQMFTNKYGLDQTENKSSNFNSFNDKAIGTLVTGGGLYGGLKAGKFVGKKSANLFRRIGDISTKDVKWVKERGPKNIFTPQKEQPNYIQSELAPKLWDTYEAKTTGAMTKEGQIMSKALSSIKTDYVNLPKTFNGIREILKGYNLVDSKGNLTAIPSEAPSAIKMLAKMYEDVNGMSYKSAGKVTMPKGWFQFYRKALRTVQRGAGEFNKDVQTVINNLYDDIEQAGAKGINEAKQLYSQASKLEEEFGFSKDTFATKLQSAANEKSFERIRESLKPVFGNQTEEIFNNIKDHMISQKFSTKNLYPSQAGFGRFISRPTLKAYYEKIYPLVSKGKQSLSRFGKFTKGKTMPALATYGMISQAAKGEDWLKDPEAYNEMIADILGLELAEKGSEERKYQTGRLI